MFLGLPLDLSGSTALSPEQYLLIANGTKSAMLLPKSERAIRTHLLLFYDTMAFWVLITDFIIDVTLEELTDEMRTKLAFIDHERLTRMPGPYVYADFLVLSAGHLQRSGEAFIYVADETYAELVAKEEP